MSPGDVTRGGVRGPSTRAAHAGLPAPEQGEPFLPGPALGAPFHLAGEVGDVSGYNRDGNPTWVLYEQALAELEGADVVLFSSGMAAVHAALETTVRPGDVLVAPSDGYPGIRAIARDHLEPRGIEVRLVPTDDAAVRDALPGATAVFLESPSNPALNVLDIAAIAPRHRGAGRGRQHAGGPAAPGRVRARRRPRR